MTSKQTRRHQAKRKGRGRNIVRDARSPEIIDVESVPDSPTCIDLTQAPDEDFVDLTRMGNLSPVVLLSTRTETVDSSEKFRIEGDASNVSEDSGAEDLLPAPFHTKKTANNNSSNSTSTERGQPIMSPQAKYISCPVCLDSHRQIGETGRQLVSTTCGHIFCNMCLRESVEKQKKCPTCRKRLTPRQFHPIFL